MSQVRHLPRLRFSLVLLGLAFAACSHNETTKPDENAYPTAYRSAIVATVTSSQLFDPTNIRDASISEPALKPVGDTTRYVACVRFNPRTFSHQYKGLTEYVVYFFGGDINQFVEASGGQCAGTLYTPFPELEKICKADKCS
jgi:hypothetical protein